MGQTTSVLGVCENSQDRRFPVDVSDIVLEYAAPWGPAIFRGFVSVFANAEWILERENGMEACVSGVLDHAYVTLRFSEWYVFVEVEYQTTGKTWHKIFNFCSDKLKNLPIYRIANYVALCLPIV